MKEVVALKSYRIPVIHRTVSHGTVVVEEVRSAKGVEPTVRLVLETEDGNRRSAVWLNKEQLEEIVDRLPFTERNYSRDRLEFVQTEEGN